MSKTTKILTALTLLVAICSGGYYYLKLYPDHKDISRLETLIHQREFYDDKLAKAELDTFPIDRLKQLADKNYPLAQYQLANSYIKEKNKAEARKWLSLAANQGFAPAYRVLAYTYDFDSNERKTFLAKAASLGDVLAKYDSKNIPLIEELAQIGFPLAQNKLINLYYNDKDTQNWEKAFYWADKYYENTKKNNTNHIFRDSYQILATLYYLGIGTTPDIAKAEKILAEYVELPDDFTLSESDKKAFKDLDYLKMELVVRKDRVIDKVVQAKIQQISDELQANNGATRFFKQAKIFLKMAQKEKKKGLEQLLSQDLIFFQAIDYFGVACDMGSQAGCDKYAELNTK